ncbi:MAG: flagellin [Desulfovibrionaceae bacterium]
MAIFSLNYNEQAGKTRVSLKNNEDALQKAITRLSTGKKFNNSADGPASFSLLSKMDTDLKLGDQGVINGKNGTTFLHTADAALAQQEKILTEIAVKAEDAANGVWTDEQRGVFNAEAQKLLGVIDNIALSTEFNGQQILTGDFSGANSLSLQLGTTSASHDVVIVSIDSARSEILFDGGVDTTSGQKLDLSTAEDARTSLSNAQDALKIVRDKRADIGATQNSISYSIANRESMNEQTKNTISTIGDADVSLEMEEYTNFMAKSQASLQMYMNSLQNSSRISQMVQSV